MTIEFQMTGAKLVEALNARMVALRPCIPNPIPFGAEILHVAWIDVGGTSLSIGEEDSGYILNVEIDGDIVTPEVGGAQVLLHRLNVIQDLTVQLVSRSGMKAANDQQAATIGVGMQVVFELFTRVNKNGGPRLCVRVKEIRNVEAPVDDETVEQLLDLVSDRASNCLSLSLTPLARVTNADPPRVFNAGIAARPDLSQICLRFETDRPGDDAKTRWEAFHQGGFTDRLHGRDWALLIPEQMIVDAVPRVLEQNLANNDGFDLQSSIGASWSPSGSTPRILVGFSGEIIDACVGIDLDVDVSIDVRITAPQPNLLRTSITLSWDGDFWEELGCEMLATMFWPIVGALFVDEGKLEWGHYFGGLAAGPAVILFAIIGYLSSDEPASNIPAPSGWIKDSDTEWHQDTPFPESLGGIRGLAMNLVTVEPEGMLLGGAVELEQPTVPALKTLPHPFDGWRLTRPCHSLSSHEAEASIGVIADPLGSKPRLPLWVCGAQTLNDPLDFYADASGPGGAVDSYASYEVTVRTPPPGYAADPYDLEVLILSNNGCRLITIESPGMPPQLPDDPQEQLDLQLEWSAWKARHCWKFVSVWDNLSVLNPLWLVDPPPWEAGASHWWIGVSNLAPGERITLRDGLGRDLMTSVAGADGKGSVSGFVEQGLVRSDVWLSRDRAWLSTEEYRALVDRLPPPDAEPEGRIAIRQTLLQLLAEIKLPSPAEALGVDYRHGVPTVVLRGAGEQTAYSLADPARPAVAILSEGMKAPRFRPVGDSGTARLEAPVHVRREGGSVGPAARSGAPALGTGRCGCGGEADKAEERQDTSEEESHEEPATICRCCGRPLDLGATDRKERRGDDIPPWYRGGARLGRLYVRVDDAGRRLRVYRIVTSRTGFGPRPLLREIRQGSNVDPTRKGGKQKH